MYNKLIFIHFELGLDESSGLFCYGRGDDLVAYQQKKETVIIT